jgi:hypothetical protein
VSTREEEDTGAEEAGICFFFLLRWSRRDVWRIPSSAMADPEARDELTGFLRARKVIDVTLTDL